MALLGSYSGPVVPLAVKSKVSPRGGREKVALPPSPQVLRKRLLRKPPFCPDPRRKEKPVFVRLRAAAASLSSFWRWERTCCPITTCMSSCRRRSRVGIG